MSAAYFRTVRPYIVILMAIITVATLILAIYFTRENLPWTAFLAGVLVASILAEAVRASHSEWLLMRRTVQLSVLKEKHERLIRKCDSNEQKLSNVQTLLQLIDEKLQTIIILVDRNGHCHFHNKAFRELTRLRAEQIEGRHIRALFGSKSYAEMATAVQQSLDGHPMYYEHTQQRADGALYRLEVEHIPQFDAKGKVSGFYILAKDITRRDDLDSADKPTPAITKIGKALDQNNPIETAEPDDSDNGGLLFISAMQRGEFHLYCQLISPLPIDSGKSSHYEILLRLIEEEGSMIPPGEFFYMAEKSGLMPYLDRWVVGRVLQWAAHQQVYGRDLDTLYFINISAATIGDPGFPIFLQNTLFEHHISGNNLCFEIADADLSIRNDSVTEFINQVKQFGCSIALSGFGKNNDAFNRIRGFQVEFLKIEGGIIINMLNDPAHLARVKYINHLAKKIGVKTIAELVENDRIIAKLSEIGVDYSQGASISCPHRLTE